MKIRVLEIGDKAKSVVFAVPTSVLKALGWKDGDEVQMDTSMSNPSTLLLFKQENPVVKVVKTNQTDKSREIKNV